MCLMCHSTQGALEKEIRTVLYLGFQAVLRTTDIHNPPTRRISEKRDEMLDFAFLLDAFQHERYRKSSLVWTLMYFCVCPVLFWGYSLSSDTPPRVIGDLISYWTFSCTSGSFDVVLSLEHIYHHSDRDVKCFFRCFVAEC